ncbi:penicillin-binding protein 1B [Pseudofulvimonas gallinarii]|uniref:Penicillin-binding protein 1B n=1 Tax=Pseudofulvimonas gallinarii TaxID=634155 RepID=A0A4S3KU91_9GAMM|nr:penicillin-binding protein 1B [Pseudofulvimonas gallinarii]TCT00735.1 penicillin-binding protein 1B [Pseudofulvimonas gallinarii]THD12773.1 penicillin-binding protein 1B [Pseudofulvimonas gallinarii]
MAFPWKPVRYWLLRVALLGLGIGLGFALPYGWYLDRQVAQHFAAFTASSQPSRVYARALILRPNMAMTAATLEAELLASQYQSQPQAMRPGTYEREGESFLIHTREFDDPSGRWPARRFRATIGRQRVQTLAEATGRLLQEARIDPARIATFYGPQQREQRPLRLTEMPPLLIAGVQAVEDRDFKHHRGVDPVAIVRAAWRNLTTSRTQGGSTITQQLVRNLFLSLEQTWTRKINEAFLAVLIEARQDKGLILEMYLNDVFMGQQGGQAVHGMAAASEFYFARDVDELGVPEIALLVGLIQGPSWHNPRRHPDRARKRRDLVLHHFHETGLISQAEYRHAQAQPLGVTAQPGLARNRHPAFLDMVRVQLGRGLDSAQLGSEGLSIHTTLAPSAQSAAENAVVDAVGKLRNAEQLDAAVIITDPHSGDVLAAVGGRETRGSGFNRVMQAQRPIGSLAKPFVYLAALAQPSRWSLATVLDDAPIRVSLPGGRSWEPKNFDGRPHGPTLMIDALAKSYNLATVQLGMAVGVDRVAALMSSLAGGLPVAANPSLTLGAIDLSPMQVAQIYGFLASGGQGRRLRALTGVLDARGRVLARVAPAQATATNQAAVALVDFAMQEAVRSGTARAIAATPLAAFSPAGKTGTSNDGRDSWFAGFTGNLLAVVWVGNDDNAALNLTGSSAALPVWIEVMRRLPQAPLSVDARAAVDWQSIAADGQAMPSRCDDTRTLPFVPGFAPDMPRWGGCIDNAAGDLLRRIGGTRD